MNRTLRFAALTLGSVGILVCTAIVFRHGLMPASAPDKGTQREQSGRLTTDAANQQTAKSRDAISEKSQAPTDLEHPRVRAAEGSTTSSANSVTPTSARREVTSGTQRVTVAIEQLGQSASPNASSFVSDLLALLNDGGSPRLAAQCATAFNTEQPWPQSIASVVDSCGSVLATARNHNAETRLAQDVLVMIAEKCPSSVGRVWSSQALLLVASADPENHRVIVIPREEASHAVDQAISFALEHALAGDVDAHAAMKLIRSRQLITTMLLMQASLCQDAKSFLSAASREMDKKLSRAAQAVTNKDTLQDIEGIQKELQMLSDNVEQYSKYVTSQQQLESLIGRFVAAVNREDRDSMPQFLTAKAAASLAAASSLRATVSGVPEAKEVRVTSLGAIRDVGGRHEVTLQLAIFMANDVLVNRSINIAISETPDGLRIGDK